MPLDVYRGWMLEVDCGGPCPRGRLYRIEELARHHGDRKVGEIIRRFRCQVCSAGPIKVTLTETFERRRVPLIGPDVRW